MELKQLRELRGLTQDQSRSELKFKSGGIIDISERTLRYWEANNGATGKPSQVRFYRNMLEEMGK